MVTPRKPSSPQTCRWGTITPMVLQPLALALCASVLSPFAIAQQRPPNYDETKVPAYVLPDPLKFENGKPVADRKAWELRRTEILRLFEANMYGKTLGGKPKLRHEVRETDAKALGGTATRKQIRIFFSATAPEPKLDLLLYTPNAAKKPVPIFLVPGFSPNQAVNADSGILLGDQWTTDPKTKVSAKVPGNPNTRGSGAASWNVEQTVERGFGLATFYYPDVEPDFDGAMQYSVRSLFPKPGPHDWGAIGAWAWGLSRAMDYFETDKSIDAKRVVLMGVSRMGKTALWAGAQDPRFAVVISCVSGEGGAAISRRKFGEQVADLNTRFPHWFARAYREYDNREETLPVDQHMLLSLIAPRPLYISSAEDDKWADPKGEFLSLVAAGPVYRLFGRPVIEGTELPEVNHPITAGVLGHHIRTGKHGINKYDWEQYLNFAERVLPKK